MSSKEIRCPRDGCNALFGIVENGILFIKNRDLERYFEDGRVYGPCRKCGGHMEWRSGSDGSGTR